MPQNTPPHLLFAAYMAGGLGTILQNLQDKIANREDVVSAWLRIEMDGESSRLDRRPRRPVIPGTFRNSIVTGRRIRELEQSGGSFDAAYFLQQTICMFLWRFRRRVPYVVAMDGSPFWYSKHGLWYAQPHFDPKTLLSRAKHELTRRVYHGAAHLLPWSHSLRQSLIEDYGIPPERVSVVPPGINLKTYPCPDRRAAHEDERPFTALFVGYDFLRKGGDLLVKLAQEPEFRDVQFNFVTRAFQGPAPRNVRVLDDVTPNSPRMVGLLREADIFVLPTRADSHSVASLEAMAMGLPVITTAVGGVVDVVRDGETGYLVPIDDLPSLADRLIRLRKDRELRLRMGLCGRERVESHFDGDVIAAQVVDILKRAVSARA